MCGSAKVTELFCEWAKKQAVQRYKTWEQFCDKLVIDEAEFMRKLSTEFEAMKVGFDDPAQKMSVISIRGNGNRVFSVSPKG